MKRWKLATTSLVAFLLATIDCGVAQESSVRLLKGIRAFDIIIEDIDPNDCDVSADDVRTSMLFALSQSRIKVLNSPKGSTSYLYLNTSLVKNCTAAHVELEVESDGIVSANQREGFLVLWHTGVILSGSPGTMRQRVLDEVEAQTKKLVVKWSTVNPD